MAKAMMETDMLIQGLTEASKRLQAATHAAAKAQYEYEQSKHLARSIMYQQKMEGMKFTEEQIRSSSMVQTDKLNKIYLETQAELEAARAQFETAKIIAGK